MFRLSQKTQLLALVWGLGLLALVTSGFVILRPVVQARRALQLLAAIQVGQTTTEEFQSMARHYGVDLRQHSDTFDLSQQNSVLSYLHLAPQTVMLMNAKTGGGVVNLVVVRAWVGRDLEFANISIREFDTDHGGCGGASVCVIPTTSTMATTVFFAPKIPPAKRAHLLSLNTWCLAKLGGCKSSREFFPVAWER